MKDVKRYFTANASDLIGLDKIVNRLIKEGWQPYGNPYLLGRDICQALVHTSGGSEAETAAALNVMLQSIPSQIMRPKKP